MSRYLNDDEINYILDFLKPSKALPDEIALSIVKKNKFRLEQQLRKEKIYPEVIEKLKKNIKKQYFSTLIEPGENVGIQAAQSMGKEQTQTALDAFHKAGAKVSLLSDGNSRFNELLNMTKEPKEVISKIYFKENNKTISSLRNSISSSIAELTFEKIINYSVIFRDREDLFKRRPSVKLWYNIYENIYNDIHQPLPTNVSGIVYVLDKNKLFEYQLSLIYIIKRLKEILTFAIVVESPFNIAEIHIYFTELEQNDDYYISVIDISNKEIEPLCITGIKGIKDIFYLKEDKEWILEASGSNLSELLSHPLIDNTRTISNKIWDIYNLLGIEASREFLVEEFSRIMTNINNCEIQLLADIMTYSGILSSISRHAMKRDQAGSLGKAAFEETLDNLVKAGIYGETDNIQGVSASIICGKLPRIGSGVVDILYDLTM